jgi:hypothetical protein
MEYGWGGERKQASEQQQLAYTVHMFAKLITGEIIHKP